MATKKRTKKKKLTKEKREQRYRDAARAMYHRDGEIEIDSDAKISEGEGGFLNRNPDPDPGWRTLCSDGAYVQAWVWVSITEAFSITEVGLA